MGMVLLANQLVFVLRTRFKSEMPNEGTSLSRNVQDPYISLFYAQAASEPRCPICRGYFEYVNVSGPAREGCGSQGADGEGWYAGQE